jgi:hypothetical protein
VLQIQLQTLWRILCFRDLLKRFRFRSWRKTNTLLTGTKTKFMIAWLIISIRHRFSRRLPNGESETTQHSNNFVLAGPGINFTNWQREMATTSARGWNHLYRLHISIRSCQISIGSPNTQMSDYLRARVPQAKNWFTSRSKTNSRICLCIKLLPWASWCMVCHLPNIFSNASLQFSRTITSLPKTSIPQMVLKLIARTF